MNYWTEDLNSFELFIENNAKSLKHLDITSFSIIDKENDGKTFGNNYHEINKFDSFIRSTVESISSRILE